MTTLRHGKTRTPEWKTWSSMRERCLNKKHKRYMDYGGRGITIDPRWDVFENFLEDVGPRPSPRHSLDRKNNDGPYTKKNCRWATRSEQGRNKRNTRMVEINGRTQSLFAWVEELGLNWGTVNSRIYHYGWDPMKAITTPVRRYV